MTDINLDSLNDEDFKREYDRLINDPNATVSATSPEMDFEEEPEEQVEQTEEEVQPEAEEDVAPEAPAEGAESDEGEGEEQTEEKEEIPAPIGWERVGVPFKANGTELKVNTPEEAIKLMQMGANYTQKMQKVSKDLKIVEALRNEGLLDQEKINNLIDIYKKNPQAIAKLIQEGELDPLSLDSEEAQAYVPKDYGVSDEEFRFQQVLDDIVADPDGMELLKDAQGWDTNTKLGLQKDPSQLNVLVEQKKSGVYGLITQELERQKLFNPQLANMPFLDAYQAVGNYLLQQQNQQPPQAPVPVEVRAQSSNTAKPQGNVKAAAQVRNSQPKQISEPDWESMSDEEFAQYYNKFVHKR
ncbi:aspartic and glutamic acid-rich protein-like [Procambarus clarkii]|uniref:aspartic and glutamic acid-rich protein-like n=1 Tax=Procambarus clarkii TaxID=6728 RepID=UPI003743D58A